MPTAKQIKSKYRRKGLSKKIIKVLLVTGAIYFAASSPYFVRNVMRNINKFGFKGVSKKQNKEFSDVFSYLKRKRYLNLTYQGAQLHVSLTERGKKRAREYQIDDLEIARPKTWDKLWRILIFDVPEEMRIKREALRGKLKDLGFSLIQKSVWVHPYDCKGELIMLRDFFGLEPKDYIFVETKTLEGHEERLKKRYGLG